MHSVDLDRDRPHPSAAPMRFPTCLYSLAVLVLTAAPHARALDGDVIMHDPSTIVRCDGRYWVYATGWGISVHSSADLLTWRREPPVFRRVPAPLRAAVPRNNGRLVWAPDVGFLNGEYFLYYGVSSWGSEVSAIGLATSPTLDPTRPNYRWTDRGVVVRSKAGEGMNDIDPCIFRAPDGSLWLTFGSYIGTVDIVQLDPRTGLRLGGSAPEHPLSSASEASALVYRSGYYYLFVNRGSCCRGVRSTYHIMVGRSRFPTGPYLDPKGREMLHGGGGLFLASRGGEIGPGHFGLLKADGTDLFSCHYEADSNHHNRPVLDIHYLLWTADGWPKAGGELGARAPLSSRVRRPEPCLRAIGLAADPPVPDPGVAGAAPPDLSRRTGGSSVF